MDCSGCCKRNTSDKQKSGNQINMRMQIMANGVGQGRDGKRQLNEACRLGAQHTNCK